MGYFIQLREVMHATEAENWDPLKTIIIERHRFF